MSLCLAWPLLECLLSVPVENLALCLSSGFPINRSKAVLCCNSSLYIDGLICGICFVVICSSFLLLLVPWDGGCAL